MRVAVVIVAVLIVLIGATFAGQGLGYISGSPMTNDIHWFWIGCGMAVVGVALGGAVFLGRPSRA